MKVEYIFLLCVAILGTLSGFGLIYTTLRYKEQFEDYKKELLSDIFMTVFPILCIIVIIYMGTH